jgi:cellulose synthase/poly-beta-1,6-N-acetylglucosamine synthase-like glycosyltransferase
MISIVIISKDEASLDGTLTAVTAQAQALEESAEIVVVDASDGRLDYIRVRHQAQARWVQFDQPPGVTVSIPHQRNAGVRAAEGEIIVFTDAGCRPEQEWLAQLVRPLLQDEHIATGITLSPPGSTGESVADRMMVQGTLATRYIKDCSTINLAFRREVFDTVGGFDEGFAYGSDIDFSWRVTDADYRIRGVPDAITRHDAGTLRRQLRRSYVYGKARVRLYRKHRARLRHLLRNDFAVVAYPVFLLGLPLTLISPFYPALLLIPAWRNRSDGAVGVLKNLTFGAGVLAELLAP